MPAPADRPAASPSKANWNLINRRWHANFGMFAALTLGLVALSCFPIAHKFPGGTAELLKQIHFGKFLPADLRWIWIDLQGALLLWLIVSGWLIHLKTRRRGAGKISADSAISSVIIHEGDSPRAAARAHALAKALSARRLAPVLVRLGDHAQVDWTRVAHVLCVLDSERPAAAEAFRAALSGRAAPALRSTRVAALDCAAAESAAAPEADPALLVALIAKGARPLLAPTATAASATATHGERWSEAVLAALDSAAAPARPVAARSAPARSAPARGHPAFTLIELLSVIAILGVLAAVLIPALGNSERFAAQAAQRTLASIAIGLRGQAAVQKEKLALLVPANASDDGYLRRLEVAAEIPDLSNGWRLTGQSFELPRGYFLVPKHDHPDVARGLITLVGGKQTWDKIHTKGIDAGAADPKKSLDVRQSDGLRRAPGTYHRTLEMKPDGKGKPDGKLAFAPASTDSRNRLVFARPEAVLGLEFSDFGEPFLLDSPEEF